MYNIGQKQYFHKISSYTFLWTSLLFPLPINSKWFPPYYFLPPNLNITLCKWLLSLPMSISLIPCEQTC